MKTMNKVIALFLVVVSLFSVFSVAYAQSSATDIKSGITHLMSTTQFKIGTYNFTGPCWRYVNDLCNQLFGVSIGSPSGYKQNVNTNNWTLVTQKSGPMSQSTVADILKQCQPGDVIQYVNTFTKPQHTLIVFAVSSGNSIVVYDAVSRTGISQRNYSYSNLDINFGKFSSESHGISVYRCKKDVKNFCTTFHGASNAYCTVCNKVYKYTVTSMNQNGKLQCSSPYGVNEEPYAGAPVKKWLNSGTNVKVIGQTTNAYQNRWFMIQFSEGNMCKTGWVYSGNIVLK